MKDNKPDPGVSGDIEVLDTDNESVLARYGEELAPLVWLVNVVLASAFEKGASHICIDPDARQIRVQFCIDGVLYDVMSPPLKMRDAITWRIKSMSKLEVTEKRLAQQGRMNVHLRDWGVGIDAELHVSCKPTRFGENILVCLPGGDNPVDSWVACRVP
jgi:type IV pilus assembly protein PilB